MAAKRPIRRKIRGSAAGVIIAAAALFIFLLSASGLMALDVPPLKGYVNDYAGMMSKTTRAKIEAELKSFEQSDSTQVFILTIPSLQGEVLEEYSIKVAEKWKAGQKGKDNGILLLVANQDRKIRLEVGRGLEGKLTDLVAGQIVDLVMKPRFKRGDFDGGFVSGVAAIVDATRGEFKAEQRKAPKKGSSVSYHAILALVIMGGAVILFLGGISKVLAALGGAVGLPALVYFGLFPLGLIPLIALAVAGVGIGLLLPLLFSGHGGGGGWFFWGGGFGGGGGGGSDDGGGFDGGGGGDFGGGGASGDW